MPLIIIAKHRLVSESLHIYHKHFVQTLIHATPDSLWGDKLRMRSAVAYFLE